MSGAPEENQQKDDAKVEEIQAEFRKLYGGGARQDESFGTRISREFKRNPFLPIGMTATVSSLAGASLNFRNSRLSYVLLQSRVYCQAFTIGALFFGKEIWSFVTGIDPKDYD